MSKTQIAMLLLLVGAALFYYVHDIKGKPEREKAETAAKRLFPELKKDGMAELTVEKLKDPKTKEVLAYSDGKWLSQGPPAQLLGTQEVGNSIKALIEVQRKKELTTTPGPDILKEYGLDQPAYKVTLKAKDGKTETLLLGNKTPDDAGYYARATETGPVVSVGGDFGTLLTSAIDSMREKSPLPVEPSKANRVLITTGDGKQLEAKLREAREKPPEDTPDDVTITNLSEDWDLAQPEKVEADGGKVRDLLWAWKNLKAGRFLKPDEKIDFGKPALKLEVWTDGQTKPQVLEVGSVVEANKKLHYVRRLDPEEVMVVELADPKLLSPEANSLKNRHFAKFEVDQVERVEVTAGNVELAAKKSGEHWKFSKPATPNADEAARDQAVNDLLWEVKNGEWSEPTGEKRELKARIKVALFDKQDKPLGTVILGEATGKAALVQLGDDKTVYKLADDPFPKWDGIIRRATEQTPVATPGAPPGPPTMTPGAP